MKLYIGSKNYSSWSLRPWLVMRRFQIPFEEKLVLFDSFEDSSKFKTTMKEVAPTAKVPTLVDASIKLRNGKPLAVWDSLAICEYLAEKYPEKQLWPKDPAKRAHARSVCAELHSGLQKLRSKFPFNLEVEFPDIGPKVFGEVAEARRDVERVVAIFRDALEESNGPFLFGDFSIADAYYAPVVIGRFKTYHIPVNDVKVTQYMQGIGELPEVKEWVSAAKQEKSFFPNSEAYRKSRL